eukprot:2359663-Amphidinium_carterae.1
MSWFRGIPPGKCNDLAREIAGGDVSKKCLAHEDHAGRLQRLAKIRSLRGSVEGFSRLNGVHLTEIA